MSWVRAWIHLVFSTKERIPYMGTHEVRRKIIVHIFQNAKEKEILIYSVNGYSDHLHCLFLLNRDQSISKVAQLIKGESAFWINKNKLLHDHFEWQDDYWAVSVGENDVQRVKKYIASQEEHHSKRSFSEEIDTFQSNCS